MREQLTRLPPGGSPISASSLLRVLRGRHAADTLRRALSDRLGPRAITLHASGREALRVAFKNLGAATGRNEVAIPAYSCFSIPAAAVAAGLRVRLVDVGDTGQIDNEALARLPMERVAGVVVANLFGIPEAIENVRRVAQDAGSGVIDDAAQTLGGSCAEGKVGARGDIGILSFGRGKPVSALGGGAVVWREAPVDGAVRNDAEAEKRWAALLRAGVYDVARIPVVLRALSSIPALGIGETVYDPTFTQGPMSGAAVALAAAILPELDACNASRADRAKALAARMTRETDFTPLLAGANEIGIYPRIGVLAPTSAKRDEALEALRWLGATRMYPAPLDSIPGLEPYLVGDTQCQGAYEFSARLLTLPTHTGMSEKRIDTLIQYLQRF